MSLCLRCLAVLVVTISALPARAEDPPFSDLAGREPVVRDLSPRPVFGQSDAGDGAALSLAFTTRLREERRDYGASLALTLPTGDFWGPPAIKAKRRAEEDGDAPPASPGESRVVPRPNPGIPLPLVRPRDARAAISAALERVGLGAAHERLHDLDARSRWSGLMPRLRLRATRLVDESTSLSPTSYDDDRTTASGGASLWLEARATFNLDRLVFASDELRVERMRRELAEDAEKISARVLEAIFAWQRSLHALYEPLIDPVACTEHALLLEELAVRLDLLTDGWFGRWQSHHPLPDGSCLDLPDAASSVTIEVEPQEQLEQP